MKYESHSDRAIPKRYGYTKVTCDRIYNLEMITMVQLDNNLMELWFNVSINEGNGIDRYGRGGLNLNHKKERNAVD